MIKNSRKWFAMPSLVAVMAVLLTGCGGGTSGGGGAGSTGNSSNQGSSSQSKPVTIKLGYFSSSSSDAEMKTLIKKFEQSHPNIKVTTETAPYGQFFQKLDVEVASGTAPDVWLSDGVYVMKYAQRGVAENLTSLVNKDLTPSDYYGLNADKGPKGNYWAVPQGIQIGALFYNKDEFQKAGVAYPNANWTWTDLMNAAKKLTLDGKGRNALDPNFNPNNVKQFGFKFNGITEGWFPIMKAFGGGPLDSTMTKSMVTSAANTKAYNFIVSGTKDHVFTTPDDIKSFSNSMSVFSSGSAAMRIGLYTRTLDSNKAGINYDVTVLPKGPTGQRFTPEIANSWMIYKKSSSAKQAAAWQWIKWWVSNDQVQSAWAKLGEAVPVKKSVANSSVFLNSGTKPANKQAFLDSFKFGGPLDANAVWSEWVNAFQNNMNPAFNNKESIATAEQKANTAVQKVLNKFYKGQ